MVSPMSRQEPDKDNGPEKADPAGVGMSSSRPTSPEEDEGLGQTPTVSPTELHKKGSVLTAKSSPLWSLVWPPAATSLRPWRELGEEGQHKLRGAKKQDLYSRDTALR